MKRKKTIIIATVMVAAVSAIPISAYAASSYNTPAEAVAGITGRSVSDVLNEKAEARITCGQIAAQAGRLEEFKTEFLEMKKTQLQEQVDKEKITQQQANEAISRTEQNVADYDGTSAGIMQGQGNSTGVGAGNGNGQDAGNGTGWVYHGNGNGQGHHGSEHGNGGGYGRHNSSCINR